MASIAIAPFKKSFLGQDVSLSAAEAWPKERINGFIAAYPKEFLRVDTPQVSSLRPWLTSVGLNLAGKGWSMRRSPRTSVPNTHALASQALGSFL